MTAISLAEARARLSELIDRVEAGESIDIAALRALAATMPPASECATALVRSMRETDRY